MRVLVTRPEADSQAMAAGLAALGIEAIVAPMLRIVPEPKGAEQLPAALEGVRALLFTSANGVAAFAALHARRDWPVLAVGPATEAAARDAGFAEVHSADGDQAALVRLVAERFEPGPQPLLHASGEAVAGDLAAALAERGFAVRRVVLYRAEPVGEIPAAARAALTEGTLDGVLLFSPRTAERFVALAKDAGEGILPRLPVAYCLSPAVAEAASPLPWRAVRVAEEPNLPTLLRLVESDRPNDKETAMKEPEPAANGAVEAPPPAPAAAPAPTRATVSLAATVAVAALVALAIGLSAPLWRGIFGLDGRAPAATVDLGPLEARIGALERRPPPDTAPLSDAIRRLQADIARLSERPTSDPALTAEVQRIRGMIDGLTRRLAETETAMRDNRLRDRIGERALVAVTALRNAAERGPFPGELEAARAALAEDAAAKEAIEALAPYADKGVPDAGQIARRFDLQSAAIIQAARRTPDGDWVDRTVERMSSVLTVRRVEQPVAGTPDAHVATAEKALAARDVAAALEALAPIRDAVSRAAPQWLADAEARRAVDTATTRAARRVAAILGQDR
ncbi:hypothetical protein STAQ_47440 [Allostella sp. ATCC 35155]|nr:hypothetical protein STAQ_47440 [Stella sp. ATCC 35155]